MEILIQDPWLNQFCPANTLPTITVILAEYPIRGTGAHSVRGGSSQVGTINNNLWGVENERK